MNDKSRSLPDSLENLFEQSKKALEKALSVRKRAHELRGNSANVISETTDLLDSLERKFKDYRIRNEDDSKTEELH